MNIEIANRLQKLRKEKGYSQEQLADALGISRQAVSKWERAEASPDTDNLICLAKLYGVSLDELLFTDQTVEDIKNDNINEAKENNNHETQDKDHVHISIKGIDVLEKNGDHVHVGWDGIHVNSKESGENVDISAKGIYVNNKRKSKVRRIVEESINSIYVVSITILYVVLGCLYNLWHPAWILFVTIPIVPSIISAISNRKFKNFAYPVLVVAVYLYLGCVYNLWHPYWFLFITIPLYYVIFGAIDKIIHRNEPKIYFNGDELELGDVINDEDKVKEMNKKMKDSELIIDVEEDQVSIKTKTNNDDDEDDD